ncbi:MAG: hypothetical protein AAFN79_12015 [Pseudomonadota bacterium]
MEMIAWMPEPMRNAIDAALTFNVPIPDVLWGGALLLILLFSVTGRTRARRASEKNMVLEEHQRMARSLRAREHQLGKEKRRMRRIKRDARRF